MLCSVCSRIQLFIVLMIGGLTIALGETARPPNALVCIISPRTVNRHQSSGMGVAPAGVGQTQAADLSMSFRAYSSSSLLSVLPHAGCARMWKWPLA
jgi:hypothetical protein